MKYLRGFFWNWIAGPLCRNVACSEGRTAFLRKRVKLMAGLHFIWICFHCFLSFVCCFVVRCFHHLLIFISAENASGGFPRPLGVIAWLFVFFMSAAKFLLISQLFPTFSSSCLRIGTKIDVHWLKSCHSQATKNYNLFTSYHLDEVCFIFSVSSFLRLFPRKIQSDLNDHLFCSVCWQLKSSSSFEHPPGVRPSFGNFG